ncbi:YacL family protein [Zobellella iuensis]|uniref:YacL family protein n=1 Tax=Zobellella iuensis TaxID=2803811 RepID=A0ABS1QX14_9GAMM|nr:YacL family protein [Zobellella iuensis]MBL1379418.1 YacL family protein [Zobellella iuensis]
MDFEFFRDLTGACRARFSMGHEAFGQWLSDEVSPAEAEALLGVIRELEERRREEFRKIYAEFTLLLSKEEAELAAHTLAFANDELEEGMAYYDDELFAGCGLDDLARVLEQWRAFIKA